MYKQYLLNNDTGVSGIFRAKLLQFDGEDVIRAYIPGISSHNPITETGSLSESAQADAFPIIQWCCYNIESKDLINLEGPAWVMFENGDIKRPVAISYSVIGGSGNASTSNNSNNDSNSTIYYGDIDLLNGDEYEAEFTAYYDAFRDPNATSDDIDMQNGASNYDPKHYELTGEKIGITKSGELMDWTKNMCAAPKELYNLSKENNHQLYIKILECEKSEYVGRVYRIVDIGGAITVHDNIYDIDLMMKDKTTAYNFGRNKGKILVGTDIKS